jgi:hypothetical protein
LGRGGRALGGEEGCPQLPISTARPTIDRFTAAPRVKSSRGSPHRKSPIGDEAVGDPPKPPLAAKQSAAPGPNCASPNAGDRSRLSALPPHSRGALVCRGVWCSIRYWSCHHPGLTAACRTDLLSTKHSTQLTGG